MPCPDLPYRHQPRRSLARRATLGVFLGLGISTVAVACGAPATAAERPAARMVIVAVDRSASRASAQAAEETRAFLERLPDELRAGGDRLILMEMLGGDGPVREWMDSTATTTDPARPDPMAAQALEAFREDAREAAALLLSPDHVAAARHTHVIGTLYRMADHARAAGGREVTLVLLSDMLESSGELEFERADGVPGPQWVRQRHSAGRLPDLRNTCVVVVGADVQTSRGVTVRAFWRDYLTASGARLGAYRTMLADPSAMDCTTQGADSAQQPTRDRGSLP